MYHPDKYRRQIFGNTGRRFWRIRFIRRTGSKAKHDEERSSSNREQRLQSNYVRE